MIKESEGISKVAKTLAKREFACEEDALREIEKLKLKDFKKNDISRYQLPSQESRKAQEW